jgi:transcriptional regulator with XRE-family HTH domain
VDSRAKPVRRQPPKPTNRADRLEFGRRLREIRLAQGLSQERLAEMAELHRNYVGIAERGERAVGLDVVFALASALNVSPARFFEDVTKP